MASTENLVIDFGSLVTSASEKIDDISVKMDNGVDAVADADFSGRRLSYIETLHDLTHLAAQIVEVFDAVTTQAAFETQLALRAGSPIRVLHIGPVTDKVNGGTNEYYWSDQVVANVETLYQKPVFTGQIDNWPTTINTLTLQLTGTERAEYIPIPERVVSLANSANSRAADEGRAYPEIWGSPGTTLDAAKILSGIGSTRAVLVDRPSLKYVVAGHVLTAIAGETSGTVAVWTKVPGYDEGLGYIEGCTFDLNDTDDEGNVVATVTLPSPIFPLVFLPTIAEGDRFTNTADNPNNATGRDITTSATVDAGETLQLAAGGTVDAGEGTFRVWIATSKASVDLRVRWVGPQSTIVGTAAGYIAIDSASGWDELGKVQVGGGVEDFTSITRISESEWRLNIEGYSASDTGAATLVGAFQTLSTAEVEVTEQRAWTDTNFQFLEIELQNTHGSNSHDIEFMGFRVEVELRGYPDVFVPCDGVPVSFRSVDFGATRNPALVIEDLHTRVLGLGEARIGDTFDVVRTILSGWKFDVPLTDIVKADAFLKKVLGQTNAFIWRDGSNVIQIGLFRLDDVSSQTLTAEADIRNETGDNFTVSFTPPEEVFTRIYVKWGPNIFNEDFSELFYIVEDSSFPQDTTRQNIAVDRQAEFGVVNTLEVEASYIQDAQTAQTLLQFLFDFHSKRRRILRFQVPQHVAVEAGTIIAVIHDLLPTGGNYIIRKLSRRGDVLEIEALEMALEGNYDSPIGYEVVATTRASFLWGSPEYWDAWEETGTVATSAITGRVVDYGLNLFAERLFTDSAEKPTHGAVGADDTDEASEQLDLISQNGSRVTIDTITRDGTAVTIGFDVQNVSGGNETVREMGLFSASTGDVMLARIVLDSDITLADDKNIHVELVITCKRPTIGSDVTNYGLDWAAQRMFQDTAEKITHYAIGSSWGSIGFIDNTNDELRAYYFNGTIWVQIGNDLPIANVSFLSITALNTTDIAFIDFINDDLRTYRFDGADWVQIGHDLHIAGTGAASITSLNTTDIAFIDSSSDNLRTYRFDGTDWAQIGNDLPIADVSFVSITALNTTDIAFIDNLNVDLRTYRFDGADWVQIGNDLHIVGTGGASITALNTTDIAFIDSSSDNLRTYRFDGTDWVQIGNDLPIANVSFVSITALNTTDIAFIDSSNDNLRTYRFDGTDWAQVRQDLGGFGISGGHPAITAFAFISLIAPIGARVAIAADTPIQFGLSVKVNAAFPSSIYGSNTIREAGMFTGSTGDNCIARKVLDTEVVLGASDDFIASHTLTTAHQT